MHSHKSSNFRLFKSSSNRTHLPHSSESSTSIKSIESQPAAAGAANSAAAFPTFAKSPHDKDRADYQAATFTKTDTQGPKKLVRRTQSQRTPPPEKPSIKLIPTQSPNLEEEQGEPKQHQVAAPKPEQKKKRRFFGIGEHYSESKSPHPPESVRSFSKNLASRSGATPPSLTTASSYQPVEHWPSGSTSATIPPKELEQEESEASVRRTYRHSLATPPIFAGYRPASPQRSVAFSKSSEREGSIGSVESQTTAQAILQEAPWMRQDHPTGHKHNNSTANSSLFQSQPLQPTGSQAQDFGLAQPTQALHSRPSSRQSIDSPSPVQSGHRQEPIYHERGASFPGNLSVGETTMTPQSSQGHMTRGSESSTTQPSLSRNNSNYHTEYTQAPAQNNQTGQYGSQLSVNNLQGNNYRNSNPQSSPMVQQNSSSEAGRNTPPPAGRSRDDLSELDVKQLIQKHEELSKPFSAR
jgi:hypothetical protein